jgi:hypothetical protein
MEIPRIKGERRETRRLLAEKSRQLLEAYQVGRPVADADCPLWRALDGDLGQRTIRAAWDIISNRPTSGGGLVLS